MQKLIIVYNTLFFLAGGGGLLESETGALMHLAKK
jgi:hypothetical protein